MANHKKKQFKRIRLVDDNYMNKHYSEKIINADDKLIEENLIKECKNDDR